MATQEAPLGAGQNSTESSKLPLAHQRESSFSLRSLAAAAKRPPVLQRGLRVAGVLAIIAVSHLPFWEKGNIQGGSQLFPSSIPDNALTGGIDFQVSGKALEQFLQALSSKDKVSATELTVVRDAYGPEITRAQLETNPQSITATDYVEDANGNVIKQRAVVKGRLYESVRDQAAGTFKDFRLVSPIPMGNVTSLISSADGNTLIAGGEDPIRSANTKLVISFNGGVSWENISWPYPACGSVIDLIRFTDSNYFGNNGNWEGCRDSQFILRADPVSRTASVQAVNLTVQSTNLSIGSAHDLRVASVAGNNAQMYSAGSLSLQHGFVRVDMDYTTGIGTARNITQTIIGGQLINLGYLQGISTYTNNLGNPRLEGSNRDRGINYDINPLNPLDDTAMQTNYNNWLNDRGIPNFIDGSFTVMAFGTAGDGTGNKTAYLAGGYNSTIDGMGRAVVFNRETMSFYDLMPNRRSWVLSQKGFLRKKINGQLGYEANMYNVGKVFIPDGGNPVYTDRGLGVLYQLFLPAIMRN